MQAKACAPRGAFSLVEIIVSIGIFMSVSVIMLGALFGATELFRRTEAARQAGDEATAVLAALQEDLSRAVPVKLRDGVPATEWGHVRCTIADGAGNCDLTVVIENPDRSQVRMVGPVGNQSLIGVRKQVRWYIAPVPGDPASDALMRDESDLNENGALVAGSTLTKIVTKGCLHFGVWFEIAQDHRPVTANSDDRPAIDWESRLPFQGMLLDTKIKILPDNIWPLPDAVRVSLVLTGGGRYATRGTVARVNGSDISVSGIRTLTTVSGSLLRIENEWVRYDDFRNGRLVGLKTAQLRSAAHVITPSETVLAGQLFSLVVPIPR